MSPGIKARGYNMGGQSITNIKVLLIVSTLMELLTSQQMINPHCATKETSATSVYWGTFQPKVLCDIFVAKL